MQPSVSPGRRGLGVAVAVLFVGITALAALIYYSNRPPRIEALDPSAAAPGDEIRIVGRNFGEERGRVQIAGKTVPSSLHRSWDDTEIRIELPSEVPSGLIRVTADGKTSAGVFLAHEEQLPHVTETELPPGLPFIETIEPTQPRVGDTVAIRGRNFGDEKGEGTVYFTWQSDETTGRLAVPDEEWLYPSWDEREIRVVVPDGASPGPLSVRTAEGFSNEVPIDIIATVGTKSYHSKASYALHYGVKISVGNDGESQAADPDPDPTTGGAETSAETSGPEVRLATAAEVEEPPTLDNTVYLWLPHVYPLPEQRHRQVLSADPLPTARLRPATWLYRIEDIAFDSVKVIENSTILDRYAVRTEIVPTRVQWDYDVTGPVYRRFTRGTETIPVESEPVRVISQRTVGQERNPHSRARYIYNYCTSTLQFDPEGPSTAADVLATGKGSSLGLALTYVSLARAARVPARLVGGFRITVDDELVPHHWAEFYLASFGWVPVDPVMGSGAFASESESQSIDEGSVKEFYFGNLDNQRIVLTVDEREYPSVRQDSTGGPIRTHDFWRFARFELAGELPEPAVSPSEPTLLGTY